MKRIGHVSGSVLVRPIRVGLVVEATVDSLRTAVELATTSWGGCYFPLLPSDDVEAQRMISKQLSVDVVVEVPGVSSPVPEEPGFRWRGGATWGPFAPPDGGLTFRVLDLPSYLRARVRGSSDLDLFQPSWAETDPLAGLFTVWHGRFPETEYGVRLAQSFRHAAEGMADLAASTPFPAGTTPIAATTLDIRCTSDDTTAGIVVVDPSDPRDLISFWNLRAVGHPVFPWPVDGGPGFVSALRPWVASAKDHLSKWTRGDGVRGESLYVFSRKDIPEELAALLSDAEFDLRRRPPGLDVHGWLGSHPLQTPHVGTFRVDVSREQRTIEVPLPRIASVEARLEGWRRPGQVAAQLEIESEANLPPGYTVSLPNVRSLASVLSDYGDVLEPFHRPTHDGRATAVPADADRVPLRLLPTDVVFGELLGGDGVTCKQTENGRFSTRLIDLLGGVGSTAANQPAVREVLVRAASTPYGRPLAALISYANRSRAPWPGPLVHARAHHDYAANVVRWLTAIRVLRPHLPVRCPACTTETVSTPEELATSLRCSFCDEEFALGLALTAQRRTDWTYRLAGSIPPDRLRETLPVMAAVDLLAQYQAGADTVPPHVLGLAIKDTTGEREIDLLVAINDRGIPVVILGEAKSYRDQLDAVDLATLTSVQSRLRRSGLEAFLLYVTLRSELQQEEMALLRDAADNAPPTLHYTSGPSLALPIVLTETDLSQIRFSSDDPLTVFSLPELAVTMAERNLGLTGVEYGARPGARHGMSLVWSTAERSSSIP